MIETLAAAAAVAYLARGAYSGRVRTRQLRAAQQGVREALAAPPPTQIVVLPTAAPRREEPAPARPVAPRLAHQ